MINLRDLPGIGTLEWAVEQKGYWTEELEEWARDLAEHYFGVCDCDLEDMSDDNFKPLRMMRDEADVYWRSFGWDVTDGNGKQLVAMDFLLKPLVCVVEKLHPDANFNSQDDTDAWAAELEEAAKRFKPTR